MFLLIECIIVLENLFFADVDVIINIILLSNAVRRWS